jgi:hypothetical protein
MERFRGPAKADLSFFGGGMARLLSFRKTAEGKQEQQRPYTGF